MIISLSVFALFNPASNINFICLLIHLSVHLFVHLYIISICILRLSSVQLVRPSVCLYHVRCSVYQVHQNIESQIQQQARDIGRLSQQVINLSSKLSLLNTSTATPGTSSGGASAAELAKLQAQVSKVRTARVFQYYSGIVRESR